MTMWQHTCGVYVWRSVWRCKLDCKLKYTVKQLKIEAELLMVLQHQ
jgi:hypothetical protein